MTTQTHTDSTSGLPAYKNPALPVAERVHDLLRRMTLEEKAAQMMCIWLEAAQKLVNEDGRFDRAKAEAAFALRNGLGQVGRTSNAGKGLNARANAITNNEIQKFFVEHSRLGIPVIVHEECLHGLMGPDAISTPQPIALAATFDPALVEEHYRIVAHETRSRGAHQALTPVIDVAREPRWGRVEETFGEDPFLVAQLGIAAVKGFQGDATFRDKKHVLATLKHFVAHAQPEGGQNCAPTEVSLRTLREVFLYTFKEVIEKANARSVMASYNEVDAVPSHANRWLLRDVLRKEWGFDGFIVSDYYAIWELSYRPDTHGHFLAKDRKEAARLAVKAGVNIELPDPDCYLHLVELVHEGKLQEAELDELVAPMLAAKFELGLFEDPYVDPEQAAAVACCEAHNAFALKAARESITLLKNEGGLAPLDRTRIKKIAVVGPNANREMLGGYSGRPRHFITVLEGIREKLGNSVEVVYSEGCKITKSSGWTTDEVIASDPEEDLRQIEEAAEVARDADVIVLAIGANEQVSREAYALNHPGDMTSLDLLGKQDELVRRMQSLGKPVIVFLFHGRPISINALAANVPVLFDCFYLGQESGRAIADVLFGDANPAGKLPISVPRSAGQLPVFYNHKPSARRGYLFDEATPLYSFGYGLSYTSFAFSNARLTRQKIARGESTQLLVDVKNTGRQEGAEVVQMYIRDLISSVTRPVKELKGFRKIWLKPGEQTTVALDITPDLLKFYDIDMQYVVEPGEFEIQVGNSSRNQDLTRLTLEVVE